MPAGSAPGRWTDLERPPLSEPALRSALTGGPHPAWRALELLPSVASTNAELARRAAGGEPEGLVLVTDHQTAGRGRLGRRWETPARAALAVSVLLEPGAVLLEPGAVLLEPGEQTAGGRLDGEAWAAVQREVWSWLPLLAGVAVVDALTRVCGLPARLKWPNDVLVPEHGLPDGELRKICGILAEVVPGRSGPVVVLGVGINVSQTSDELPTPTATSLRLARSATTDRDTVLRAYLRALSNRYRAWRRAGGRARDSGVAAAYRQACVTIGLPVTLQLPDGALVSGVADGVDDLGQLMLADRGGAVRAFAAGDVVHLRPEKESPQE